MNFVTFLFLYATFIITVVNFYGGLLSLRYLNAATVDTTNAQTTESDLIKQQIHQNEIIGADVQVISHWIKANKLIPLKFDIIKQDHRVWAKNILLQLLSQQHRHRLTALFQDIYGQTNICLAKSVAKLTLVSIELDDPATLAVLTEVLLVCNDCSVLNFIQFSVNQSLDSPVLDHIEKSMEFETLLSITAATATTTTAAADDCNLLKQNDLLHDGKDETLKRFAVSAFERINRLYAAAIFIVPLSTRGVMSKKSAERRISNSSTLTSSSGISSCGISSGALSSGSSNTSINNNAAWIDSARNKYTNNSMMLRPDETSYYDIIKFKKDLLHLRLEADHLLNHFVIPLTVATKSAENMDRVKQVDQAFRALISTCMTAERALHILQNGFVFYQLAKQLATRLIDEAFVKLYQQSQIKTYQQRHCTELSTSSYKAVNITLYLLQAFSSNSSAMADTLFDRCSKLVSAFESIDTVWRRVIDIRRVIEESHDSLSMIDYSKHTSIESLKVSMSKVKSVFRYVRLCSTEKLQPLYAIVKQHTESFDNNSYLGKEKIIVGMETSLLEDMNNIQLKISRTYQDLVHLHRKKEFESNVNEAKSSLQSMNYSLCLFIALEALFSIKETNVDQEALQDRYAQYQAGYNEFTLTKYDKVCVYFSRDYDAGLNYQMLGDTAEDNNNNNKKTKKDEDYKLFEDLQLLTAQTSKLLAYCHQVLLQRRAISKYIQQLDAVKSSTDMAARYEQSLAAMTSFQDIEYPQLNMEGLSNMFCLYQHDLHLCLSQSKVALIDNFLMV